MISLVETRSLILNLNFLIHDKLKIVFFIRIFNPVNDSVKKVFKLKL
jgi:hypothetical protein